MKQITVLKIGVGEKPTLITVYNNIEEIQRLLGGYTMTYYPWQNDNACLVCRYTIEKVKDIPVNRIVYDEGKSTSYLVLGDFYVIGTNSKREYVSLTDNQIKKYTELFN